MKILITGASGYIGSYLSKLAKQKGHDVYVLSRTKTDQNKHFYWNWEKGEIDAQTFEGMDAVIHLAGENIGAGRWTKSRKENIENSRVLGTRLLLNTIEKTQKKPNIFIAASATGYYGAVNNSRIYTEKDASENDFLGKTTLHWEKESLKAKDLGLRTVLLRTGIVISKDSKAINKMALPVKYGVGANLGSGQQYFPWIHLHDLAQMYLFALENEIDGEFNAVAPEHVQFSEVNNILAKQLNRPLLMPSIPEFVLKFILGEMAVLVTRGSRVSADKIQQSGFQFKYSDIRKAMEEIF